MHHNVAQKDAITSDEPLLICACPGSGKTRVLTEKTKHILRANPSARIILTTFSRDAAQQIVKRLRPDPRNPQFSVSPEMAALIKRNLTIGTFHSLALSQLKKIGWKPHILSSIEAETVIQRALTDAGITKLSIRDATAIVEAVKCRENLDGIAPADVKLFNAYQRQLNWRNAVDFIDIIKRASLEMENGNIAPIPSDYLLADEYQDIDAIQYRWIMQHLDDGRTGIAVGDDDQSIYGFRRALGYLGMKEFQAATDARIITLSTNYRSTARILDHATQLISRNLDRVKKVPQAARGDGHAPIVRAFQNTELQIDYLLNQIKALCADNPMPPVSEDRAPMAVAVREEQVAVLTRTNIQLGEIEQAMIRRSIPYYRMGRSLWDDPLAQIITALAKSIHAGTSTGLEVALRWADPSLIGAGMTSLLNQAAGNLWNLVDPDLPAPASDQLPTRETQLLIQRARGWAANHHGATADGKQDRSAILTIEGITGWMDNVIRQQTAQSLDLQVNPESVMDEKQRKIIERQSGKVSVVKDILLKCRGSLVNRITAAMQDDAARIPRVMLGTFHGSKGLEFENVFLVDVNYGLVPHTGKSTPDSASETDTDDLITLPPEVIARHAAEAEAQEAEERRLFYVAMTRARDRLFIFHHKDKPSPFIFEAGLCAGAEMPPLQDVPEAQLA